MKNPYSLSLACAAILMSGTLLAQSPGFSVGYQYSDPGTYMRQTIRQAHHFNLGFVVPLKSIPSLEIGAELGIGSYGSQVTDQLYRFDNGDFMYAPVTVRNNMTTGGLLFRYTLPVDAAIRPFAHARVGFAGLATNLTIEDPREIHTDECPVPLEETLLQRDFSFTQGLGVGLSFDVGRMFPSGEADRYFLMLTADYLRGSTVEYMSVNPPELTIHSAEGVESITLPFSTAARPEIQHEYHSGYLYRTRLELVQFGLHFMVRF